MPAPTNRKKGYRSYKHRMWVLEKCSKYVDAVIYNLNHSLKQDDSHMQNLKKVNPNSTQIQNLRSIKIKKLQFLLRVYLQHCAVLSQLSL